MSRPTRPVPTKRTIETACGILIGYGRFRWNLQWTPQDDERLKSWMQNMVMTNKLTLKAQPKTWIGFAVVSRLIRTYLEHASKHGTTNWDITIARCLSVVLISSLGARCGDVALSSGYFFECLTWENVEVYIEVDDMTGATPSPVTVGHLRMRVTLEYTKGQKKTDQDLLHILRPLTEPHHAHMCPINWLLVHGLRHGSIVGGDTLEDVLYHAASRPDKTIEWSRPGMPVLNAFVIRPTRVDVTAPANARQITDTLKDMAELAGIADRVYGHALRNGYARDLAHVQVPDCRAAGVGTDQVRRSLGHSKASMNSGVTDKYIGDDGVVVEMHNARATLRREPVGREVRFIDEPRGVTNRLLELPSPLPLPLASELARPSSRPVLHPIDYNVGQLRSAAARPISADMPQHAIVTTDACTDTDSALGSHTDFAQLTQDEIVDAEDEAPDGVLAAEPSKSTPHDFIDLYSECNIVDNYYLGRAYEHPDGKPMSELVYMHCQTGHSRDTPTPIVHKCRRLEACKYETYERDALVSHELRCTEERVAELEQVATATVDDALACAHKGCSFRPAPFAADRELSLKQHIHSYHTFKPKACELGCDPSKLYDSENKYKYHITSKHSARWPARCTVPNCSHEGPFALLSALKYHLTTTHELNNDTMLPYIPPHEPTRTWIPQDCFVDDCFDSFKTRRAQAAHLHEKHHMTEERAKIRIEDEGQFDMIARKVKLGSKRAIHATQVDKATKRARKRRGA